MGIDPGFLIAVIIVNVTLSSRDVISYSAIAYTDITGRFLPSLLRLAFVAI